jgi:LacI family transcriptional regulator
MSNKRVTSQDVADLAGVSRTTVSFVLNNVQGMHISSETRQRVLEAAERLSYIPDASAQALASRRSKAIGLVMTRSPHHLATEAFLPQIIGGLMEVVQERKLSLLFESVEVEHQNRVYLELARAKRIDGMLLLTSGINEADLKKLAQVDIPVVLIGELAGTNLYSVDIDNRFAAQNAVQYLLTLGHTRIACITSAPKGHHGAYGQTLGYKDALASAGIRSDDQLVRHADLDSYSGYLQMKSLLAGKAFTAVFVASDNLAIGAKAALREAGLRVPEDISVVSFGDIPWTQFSDPPLTTLRLPAAELARTACLVLMDLLQGKKPVSRRLLLPTELIIRQSCRKL